MSRKTPIIQYENTVPAEFVRRNNRFTAEVMIGGQQETVHVKNTGRLRELLVPEAKVMLQRSDDPGRKTAYDLISVYKPGLKWVNIDSLVPNQLMKQLLMSMDYDVVKPEYTYGDSRFDFYMERQGVKYLTEVKGCTLAADLKKGIGLFPDAPTERGVKHIEELILAKEQGYTATLLFIVQMKGMKYIRPNDETHPAFGNALRKASETGVNVIAFECEVKPDELSVSGILPVKL